MKNNELLNTTTDIAKCLGYADESNIRKTYVGNKAKENHLYCLDVGVFLIKNKVSKKKIKAFVTLLNDMEGE